MSCHVDKGIHIPDCMGCSAADHDSCTCAADGGPNRARGIDARFLEAEWDRTHAPRAGVDAPPGGWQDTPAVFTALDGGKA